MPIAPRNRPPHQHSAATKPALRGPTRSSQPPQTAAAMPSSTKNNVYIQPMLATRQSQVVVNSSCTSDMSGQDFDVVTPSARDSGRQNTLKQEAIPIQRWMQGAAGGTSQRLKPAVAMVRSLSRIPNPPPVSVPAPSNVLIASSHAAALDGCPAVCDPG